MPRTRRTAPRRAPSARTVKRRAARRQDAANRARRQKRQDTVPETVGQARTWDRKRRRYVIAGLCPVCSAQAAWGHALGFGAVKPPCWNCQPIVDLFDTPGPKGSKWRKCLIKLEQTEIRAA